MVRRKLDPLVQRESPFRVKPKTNMPAQWVKPELVCEVEFHAWTQDGIMRMPIFLGLREDKDPKKVRREVAQLSAAKAVDESTTTKRGSTMPAASRTTRKRAASSKRQGKAELTNLDKMYFPNAGLTKGDVLDYYREMAPFILPYLKDRPLSLLRHPNGVTGKSFFQKDVSRQPPPDWVETATIPSESTGKDVRYIVCQDSDSLLYVANLGTIEINPWNSRLKDLDKPDYLVIDLDPEGVPFTAVIEAAQHVRELLEEGCADSYCKTSGKTGLHIYVPLGARYEYEQVRQFAEVIARLIHDQLPETTSVERRPSKRQHKVYLDYLQNSMGQTLAAPYSLRPTPEATVSTPLRWQEVNRKLDPTKFTLRTMPRRLDKLGDLWKPVLGKGIDLGKCLNALET
jgi:bifunctional non-homologous end joining protein LigD